MPEVVPLDAFSSEDPIRAALARDDPVAVEFIWDRYARDLFAFLQATLCSRHDAEDVLQAVFVRIVTKRQRLAKADCLGAYVFRIARNEVADFLRKRQRKQDNDAQIDSWLTAVDGSENATELAEELQRALAQLPEAQKEIVVLRVYRNKTFREIAEMLGLSLNTVASRYRYGLEKLRTRLKDRGL